MEKTPQTALKKRIGHQVCPILFEYKRKKRCFLPDLDCREFQFLVVIVFLLDLALSLEEIDPGLDDLVQMLFPGLVDVAVADQAVGS